MVQATPWVGQLRREIPMDQPELTAEDEAFKAFVAEEMGNAVIACLRDMPAQMRATVVSAILVTELVSLAAAFAIRYGMSEDEFQKIVAKCYGEAAAKLRANAGGLS
jgi:hypothetical protein